MSDAVGGSLDDSTHGHTKDKEPGLPLRDWFVLPAIGLLTVVLLVVSVELTAKRFYTRTADFAQICVDPGDALSGTYAKPNSVCRFKTYESQLDEYRFNSCGHRTPDECAVKPDGAYRIVMAGSSLAMGYEVPEEKTYAWTLPMRLSQLTGRKVELYNEAMLGHGPQVLALHFDEVLAAKPDMVLWTLTPFDIDAEKPDVSADVPKPDERGGRLRKSWSILRNIFANKSVSDGIGFILYIEQARFSGSPIGASILHLIDKSNTQYLNSTLQADDRSGYLRAVPSEDWQKRLSQFDGDMDKVAAQARAARVPLVIAFVPNRPQVLMVSMGEWPKGYNPDQLDGELRAIVEKHGGTFIDLLPAFQKIPGAERLYYPVDGHPNADGHAVIGESLASALTDGSVPALKAAPAQQAAAQPAAKQGAKMSGGR